MNFDNKVFHFAKKEKKIREILDLINFMQIIKHDFLNGKF